ncbi:MAG: cytochrome b5-like heme/steroid binding domain-containing protein [Micropruina sp.]|uniref:cytochrome b5 domain-containing protein n=1 Tax=Micropruina sp. TaxID=2737536 RepID=UPI0039E68494
MKLRTGTLLAPLAVLVLTALPLSGCSGASAPSASASATLTFSLADVAKHNTKDDCWAAVDGGVYDLTSWISLHPGGPDKIVPLCGTDATTAFRNQHDSQSKPNDQLAQFRVGDLA